MPRSTNRGINTHDHLLSDIPALATLNGVETFTFAPGTTTDGASFGTWEELYAAYTVARAERPYSFKEIVFDPRGLAAGTDIEIPALPGSPIQTFESQTTFTSKKNPTNRIGVKVAPTVVFDLLPDLSDLNAPAIFSVIGLDMYMEAGSAAPMIRIPDTRGLKLILVDSSLKQKTALIPLLELIGGDLVAELTDSDLPADAGPVIRIGGVGKSLSLSTKGLCALGKAVIESSVDLASVASSLSTDTRPSAQPGIRLPDAVALFAPAANANVRPASQLTVLTQNQLKLKGANDTPYVVQAYAFQMSGGVPVNGNTLVLGDGVLADQETFTFVAAAGAPFEVTIGGSALVTMTNLAAAITADSALWVADVITIPGGGGAALAIYRRSQTKEGLSYGLQDRAWGTIAGAANAIVASYPDPSTGHVPLSYSTPNIQALPAVDPGEPFAGWSTVSGLKDKTLVTVIDDLRSGTFQAFNPAAGGAGSWKYVADAIDTPTLISAAGTYAVQRQARLVRCTLGALDVVNLALSPFFEPGVPLAIRRTDNTAGTLNLVPVAPDTTINGVAAPFAFAGGAGGTGCILMRDGDTGWVIVGQAP